MNLPQGRILKNPENTTEPLLLDPKLAALNSLPPAGTVVPKMLVEASLQARSRIEQAEIQAKQIISDAERDRDAVLAGALDFARKQAAQELAQAWIVFHARQAKAAEESLHHNIEMARLLAERILGEQLRLSPDSIQVIAANALKSLGRARRIRVLSSPLSANHLRDCLGELQSRYDILEIVEESDRADSDLRFECDLGILDASIGLQLDNLAIALRDALARE